MPRKTTAPNAGLRERRNNRTNIGKRIALRRAALGMSQTELATKFGVSRAALSQYEVGIGDLNAGDMNYLAEILEVPVTYFFLEEGHPSAREKVEHVSAYLPLLPEREQDIILDLVMITHARHDHVESLDDVLHSSFRRDATSNGMK